MHRHSGASLALLGAVSLAACHPAAAPTNSSPASPATNTAATNLAVAPAAPAPLADTADAADAKAFLESLYAHYKTGKDSFQMFDANKRDVFDADMVALLVADQKALKGKWACSTPIGCATARTS
jgi:hypothetical protein